ncbi:hypothetical protein GCM10027073_25900 [Streptomyces chlorus]
MRVTGTPQISLTAKSQGNVTLMLYDTPRTAPLSCSTNKFPWWTRVG